MATRLALLACLLPAAAASRVVTCAAGANCTHILQSAIAAGGDFTVAGNFTISSMINLPSSRTITFAPGSAVIAQRGAFHDPAVPFFYAHAVEDLTIVGYGARWIMQRRDYANASKYVHAEDRHGLSIMSSDGVRVRGLTISETGGDGVYVFHSRGVELRDVTTDGAYRNGLSIISAENMLVAGCRFLRTAGTAPEAGIDIEPNHCRPGRSCYQDLINVSFVDVEARQNLGTGLSFSIGKMAPAAEVSVRVQGMVIEGAAALAAPPRDGALDFNIGVYLGGRTLGLNHSRGAISLTNVSVTDTAQPGLEVFGHRPTGDATTLRRCRFERVGVAPTLRWGGPNVPLLLHQSAPAEVGGLELDECEVRDEQKREFLRCDSCGTSKGPARDVGGSVRVVNPHGCRMDLGPAEVNVSLTVDCANASRAWD